MHFQLSNLLIYSIFSTGLLCGWGFTTQTGDVSDTLQKINITTYDEDYCIHNSMDLYADDETNTCGGSDKVGRGVCYVSRFLVLIINIDLYLRKWIFI